MSKCEMCNGGEGLVGDNSHTLGRMALTKSPKKEL
jgi:hypothetical protein